MPRMRWWGNGGAGGSLVSADKASVRKWWHGLLREYDKYQVYAVFLILPSDEEAIRYVEDSAQELSLITGSKCFFLVLAEDRGVRSVGKAGSWGKLIFPLLRHNTYRTSNTP